MRFLYVAPRYHTNQVPIIRGLKRKGHEVCFLSQYAGKVEDYSDLTPTVIGYSGFFLFFDRIYMALMKNRDAYAGDRKMKCGFPPIGKLKRAIRDSHGDVAIYGNVPCIRSAPIYFAKSIKSRQFYITKVRSGRTV